MEGEENKLTTFSTWTIMLGCNGNGRNSQVFGQAMKKRPTGHTRNLWLPHFRTFCELVEGEGEQTNYIFHMDYNVRV